MNRRQLLVLFILLVVLGTAALLVFKRSNAGWRSGSSGAAGEKVVTFPINEVASLAITQRGSTLHIAQKDGVWVVQERADYPADFDRVSRLIRTIWELKPVQEVKVGPSQLGRLQLTDPKPDAEGGTLLELKDKDGKRLAALLAGKQSMRQTESAFGGGFPAGRYVTPAGEGNRVSLVAESLDELDPKPELWLNRDFIKIENPSAIALSGTSPAIHWKIIRANENAPWKLADARPGEELDASKVSGLPGLFASTGFVDVLPPESKPEETGLDKPATAIFETFDGFSYTLKVGKLSGGNYPVLISVTANLPKERVAADGESAEDKAKKDADFQTRQKELSEKLGNEQKFTSRPYLISKYSIDQLLKERTQLLVEKKTEPAGSPPPSTAPGAAASTAGTPPPEPATTPSVSAPAPKKR
jgi:hypothetical protein